MNYLCVIRHTKYLYEGSKYISFMRSTNALAVINSLSNKARVALCALLKRESPRITPNMSTDVHSLRRTCNQLTEDELSDALNELLKMGLITLEKKEQEVIKATKIGYKCLTFLIHHKEWHVSICSDREIPSPPTIECPIVIEYEEVRITKCELKEDGFYHVSLEYRCTNPKCRRIISHEYVCDENNPWERMEICCPECERVHRMYKGKIMKGKT